MKRKLSFAAAICLIRNAPLFSFSDSLFTVFLIYKKHGLIFISLHKINNEYFKFLKHSVLNG